MYVSLGVSTFRRLVGEGTFPRPLRPTKGRSVWDRLDMDKAVERLHGAPPAEDEDWQA